MGGKRQRIKGVVGERMGEIVDDLGRVTRMSELIWEQNQPGYWINHLAQARAIFTERTGLVPLHSDFDRLTVSRLRVG